MTHSMMALVFFLPAMALADDDAIKTQLEKARAKHAESVGAAKTKLVAAMDAKLREVADKGDLESVKIIKSQKELFDKDRTLPKSVMLADAKTDYATDIRAAKEELRKAIEKAKEEYTKALKLAEAEALAAELKEMARPASAANAGEDPGEAFQNGARWVGTLSQTRLENGKKVTKSADFELLVKSRDGKAFTGIIAAHDGMVRAEVEGTVEKGAVTFTWTKDLTGNLKKDAVQNTVFRGTVKDKKLTGAVTKRSEASYSGTIKLTLAEN